MSNPSHKATVQALVASVLIFGAASSMAAEKVFDRSFSVNPTGLLTVNADGARISVVGSDTNQVVVHIFAKASQTDLDNMRMSATQSDGGVNVELRTEHKSWFGWGSWTMDAHIEVKVPRAYEVDAKTSGGDVRLESVSGPARLRTSGGGIEARNATGGLDGYTSGGGVHLESVSGLIQVHTSGGDIRANNIVGDIDAHTSGGEVRLLHVDGKIRADTSGGGVRCELVGANRGISASTSGGGVQLTMPRDVHGTLDAESSGGEIISDFKVATTRATEHRLSGEINGGGERIYARTSGGDIKISASE